MFDIDKHVERITDSLADRVFSTRPEFLQCASCGNYFDERFRHESSLVDCLDFCSDYCVAEWEEENRHDFIND